MHPKYTLSPEYGQTLHVASLPVHCEVRKSLPKLFPRLYHALQQVLHNPDMSLHPGEAKAS